MGRSITLHNSDANFTVNDPVDCCIISQCEAPAGYGPISVPYPLSTTSIKTYNSYGKNHAIPLPYHKHGYQATAMVEDYHHRGGYLPKAFLYE